MFSKMIDMRRTPEEKTKDVGYPMAVPANDTPDYPYGLSISLGDDELAKLDLDGNCQVGDMIDLRALAKVTNVSARDEGGKTVCRIELQITNLAIESEDEEDAEVRPRVDRSRRYAR